MKKTIQVNGMHCNSCVKLIEDKLSRLKGIEYIHVSLPDDKVVVEFDPDKISIEEIKEDISDLGYEVDGVGSKTKNNKNGGSLLQGLMYGLLPHTGCIAFIIASVLGATVAVEIFKPLLMNPYFFYILIAISFVFATISAVIYLKNQGYITLNKNSGQFQIDVANNMLDKKWKYLTTMYGTTIMINVFLFFVVFPTLANFDGLNSGIPTASAVAARVTVNDFSLLKIRVDIPCSGHAPLISGELKTLEGVVGVKYKYNSGHVFDVTYDSSLITTDGMLALQVFKTYKPTVLDDNIAVTGIDDSDDVSSIPASGVCGCGTGCTGSCGCGT